MSYDGLLINTCDLVNETKDKWGRITATVVTAGVPCRIEHGYRTVVDFKGEERLATAVVFFKSGQAISQDTRVRINGRDHGILDIQRPQDSVTEHHVEVAIA